MVEGGVSETRAPGLRLRGLEQRAAALPALVDEEGQHHQVGEHGAEVLRSVAEVVLEAIALVLQGVAYRCELLKDPPRRTLGRGCTARRVDRRGRRWPAGG